MKLNTKHMKSLPYFFKGITDPRREQGRRHRIEVVLSMAAAAILCGMCGYKAISDWIKDLSPRTLPVHACDLAADRRIKNILFPVKAPYGMYS